MDLPELSSLDVTFALPIQAGAKQQLACVTLHMSLGVVLSWFSDCIVECMSDVAMHLHASLWAVRSGALNLL